MLRVESSQVRDIIIKRGLSEAEVLALVREWRREEGPLAEKIAELSHELGITHSATRNFFRILGEEQVPPEKLLDTLADIAERHVNIVDRLAVPRPEDEATKALVLTARSAIEEGQYDRADQLLTEAETAELGAVRTAGELARQAQEAADHRRRNAAEILAERGELALTRLKYLQAAEHFKAASEQVPTLGLKIRMDYLNRYAGALNRHGDEKGDNAVLQ